MLHEYLMVSYGFKMNVEFFAFYAELRLRQVCRVQASVKLSLPLSLDVTYE